MERGMWRGVLLLHVYTYSYSKLVPFYSFTLHSNLSLSPKSPCRVIPLYFLLQCVGRAEPTYFTELAILVRKLNKNTNEKIPERKKD